jgi:uncharacterized peroxidase-related enzyme
LRRLTGDPVFAERMVQDYRRAGLDARLRAIMDYVIKITRTPVECSEDDLARLRAAGVSDDDIYDVVNTAAIFNFNNRVASAAGFMPDRAFHGTFREELPKA